jgi:hypothetical protein
MKNRLQNLLIALASLAGVFHLAAQGTAFTYQGSLTDSGAPANGSYDLTFALYNSSNGGVQAGATITNIAIGVTNGLLAVALDFGGGIFAGTNYWLQMSAQTNGGSGFTPLAPRQPVLPAPYAVFANTASNLSGTLPAANLSGSVSNGQLANSSITVKAGTGLTGGGTVALGGTATLTNAGVLAVGASGDLTASTSAGVVTLGTDASVPAAANTLVKRDAAGDIAATSLTLQGTLTLHSALSGYSLIYAGSSTLVLADEAQDFFAGVGAGNLNITGSGNNTGVGDQALNSEMSGAFNTALGTQALFSDIDGQQNTAIGFHALYASTNGSYNTVVGLQALSSLLTGDYNLAVGYAAALNATNTTGNVALGEQSLLQNTSGNYNIAVGFQAGELTTGSDNIDIGHQGVAGESGVIRLGNATSINSAYIYGVFGAIATVGLPVYINETGQLGVFTSSARFKEDIRGMDDASDVLLALRPVTFRYKPAIDPKGLPQFGLVAEEVDKVDPDLVVRDATNGIYAVRYEAVNAMLLNEFLKDHRRLQEQNAKVNSLEKRLSELEQTVQSLANKSAQPARQD